MILSYTGWGTARGTWSGTRQVLRPLGSRTVTSFEPLSTPGRTVVGIGARRSYKPATKLCGCDLLGARHRSVSTSVNAMSARRFHMGIDDAVQR